MSNRNLPIAITILLVALMHTACYAYNNPILFSESFNTKLSLDRLTSPGNICLWDAKVGHSKPGALSVSKTSGEFNIGFKNTFTITPGQFIEAQCWVKLENATGETYFILEWLKNDTVIGKTNGGSPYGPVAWMQNPISGTMDWVRLKARAFVPKDADSVRCILRSDSNTGTAWFDDIDIRIIPRDKVLGNVDKKPKHINPEKLRATDYVTVKNAHLYLKGKRFRAWSAQGNLLALTHSDIDTEVTAFKDRGFNAYRSLWWGEEITDNYIKGDHSTQDKKDYLIASLGKNGLFFWSDVLNSCQIGPEDTNIIDDPATAEEWRLAIKEMAGSNGYCITQGFVPLAWDERSQSVYHNYIKRVLNHRNPYTGLTYAEDPAFFCWELTNEEWWIMRILWGNHLKLPAYFQKGLYARWNSWLKDKYKTNDQIKQTWGDLLEGESLDEKTVMLLPLLGETNGSEMAKVLGLNVEFYNVTQKPEDFSKQRASDVIEFLMNLHIKYKNEAAKVFRFQGRKGLGSQIVPLIYDTGYSGAVLPLYMHSFGDATAVATYQDMSTHDPNSPTFPFASGLSSPPTLNGWIDNRRVLGKPAFIYENMIFAPQKYKVEWIYRLLAYAAIQDYDVISFHYYGHPLSQPDIKNPHTSIPLPAVQKWSEWEGTTMRFDEVLMSAIKIAGEIFRNGYLTPAPNPATVTLGKNSMWSFDGMFGGSYNTAAGYTTFQKGFQWAFDPDSKDDVIHGSLVQPESLKSKTTAQPTKQISYDLSKSIMAINDTRAKILVGFLPKEYAFSTDLSIQNIKIAIPPNMPFEIKGERYAGIGIVSCDGKPLKKSSRILVSAANTSFNTGFSMDLKVMAEDTRYAYGLAHSITAHGNHPVLAGKVGMTLKASWLKSKSYKMIDYNGNLLAKGSIKTDELVIPENLPVHLTIITNRQ